MEEVTEAAGDKLSGTGEVYGKNVIYRIGYLYRYRHYYTGETSKAIYKQVPVETMKRNYLIFHTMAPEAAIEDLKEIGGNEKRCKIVGKRRKELAYMTEDNESKTQR